MNEKTIDTHTHKQINRIKSAIKVILLLFFPLPPPQWKLLNRKCDSNVTFRWKMQMFVRVWVSMTFFSLQPNGKWSISVLDLVFVFIRLHAIAPTHNIHLLLQYGFKVDTLQHFRIVFYGDFFSCFFFFSFCCCLLLLLLLWNTQEIIIIKWIK